jgi:predicted ribosome quality control (RQC) complex YloA/Tae2 family protein
VPLKSLPASDQTSLPSISEALEAAYESRFEEDTFEKQRLSLLAALRKSLKAAERQILDVREGLVNSTRAENIKESGELLVANLGRASAGAKELVVDDYFAAEPGEKRTILLDPALTLHENAERYFRRYQKARDSKDILLSRQIQLEQSIIALEKAITSAESATEGAEITRIAGTVGGEILPTQSPSAGATPAKPGYDGHKIKAMKSPDGWEILVGENSTSNDFLTTKIASPSDIWLHARAVPSAHAVIRAQNRPASVSTAAIMLAAEQVARRSGAKHAGLVSVDYTLKKYVRKPRGSAPGMVTYTNEKTIDVVAKE